MKKTFLLIGCLLLLGIGVIGISCKKDDKNDKNKVACTCTLKYDSQVIGNEDATNGDLKEMGAKNCEEFADAVIDYVLDLDDDELAEFLGGEIPAGFDVNKLGMTCISKK